MQLLSLKFIIRFSDVTNVGPQQECEKIYFFATEKHKRQLFDAKYFQSYLVSFVFFQFQMQNGTNVTVSYAKSIQI